MTTTGDWRDRWEERDRDGDVIIDIWERDGKAIAYLFKGRVREDLCKNPDNLIPKPQPPRPKKYRPYTEAELWDVIQKHNGVLWVKEKGKQSWFNVDRTQNAGFLFKHYTHLDGSPFGMEVSDD